MSNYMRNDERTQLSGDEYRKLYQRKKDSSADREYEKAEQPAKKPIDRRSYSDLLPRNHLSVVVCLLYKQTDSFIRLNR